MRIIHTFWGEPAKEHPERNEVYKWMYALSACYIKLNRDAKMILYVDKLGKKVLSDILFIYDEVHIINMPSTINPVFFAAIKAFALNREPIGSVHIDGDVMLKTEECWKRLKHKMQKCDVTVQCVEPDSDVYCDEVSYWERIGYKFDCNIKHKIPCNVGVLGFSSLALKKHYINNYINAVTFASRKNDFKKCGIPDLIVEQSYLHSYCKKEGYNVGELITGIDWDMLSDNADRIGFCHLWATSKYRFFPIICQRIKENFPKVYNRIKRNDTIMYGTTKIGNI